MIRKTIFILKKQIFITIMVFLWIGICAQPLPHVRYVGVNSNYYLGKMSLNLIPINTGAIVTPLQNLKNTLLRNNVYKFTDESDIVDQFTSSTGAEVGTDKNMDVSDKYQQKIKKTGNENFIIASNLPTALNLDSVTGIISGIPTATFPSTIYSMDYGNATRVNATTITFATAYELPNTSYPTAVSSYCVTKPMSIAPTETEGNPVSIELVSTFAGNGVPGFADGAGVSAQFDYPTGVAVDIDKNVYVADIYNHKIRKITPDGNVTTLAGSTYGFADGPGSSAKFAYPFGVALDTDKNVYVADQGNHKIRKIAPDGTVTTLAGIGESGFADGPGASAKFFTPAGVAVDIDKNVYVADQDNNKIRKIAPDGVVTTLAGSTYGFADGSGTSAKFAYPAEVEVDIDKNVYVADRANAKIRKISADGTVTTLAGSGESGFADGSGVSAQFDRPYGVAVDATGNVYVADTGNHKIRKIAPDGTVTTLAGSTQGFADGPDVSVQFDRPYGVIVDIEGNVYVTDSYNQKIRKITSQAAYSISPVLPSGLVIDSITGVIAGIPSVITASNDYTIISTNHAGSFSTTITFAVNAIPDAPATAAQQFCSGATVSNLAPSGTAYKWYDSNSTTVALNDSDLLTDNTTYFVSQTSNGCEGAKSSVMVTIDSTSGPIGISPQHAIVTGTLADLTLTGIGLNWYASAISTTPLPMTTVLVLGASYYASQTINGCESNSRFEVLVDAILGTQHLEMQDVLFYPNPTMGLFHVKSPESINSISVYNNLGQMVLYEKFNSTEVTINSHSLPSGIYYFNVAFDNGTKKIKVVKN